MEQVGKLIRKQSKSKFIEKKQRKSSKSWAIPLYKKIVTSGGTNSYAK